MKKTVKPKAKKSLKEVEERLERVESLLRIAKKNELDYLVEKAKWLEKSIKIILFLALFGVLISIYLSWLTCSPLETSFCESCKEVLQSEFQSVMGVSFSLFGLIGYLLIAFLCIGFLTDRDWSQIHESIRPRQVHGSILLLSGIGLLYSVYFSMLQWSVLTSWCIMCIVSALLIATIFLITAYNYFSCRNCRKTILSLGKDPEEYCARCRRKD